MRILFFVHYFPPAKFAASVNTYEIVRRLADRGHEIIVLSQPTFSMQTAQGGKKNILGGTWPTNIKVYTSIPSPLPLSVTIPHFLNAFKSLRHDYDLAITQFHPFHCASYAGFFVKTFKKKPWIVKVQDIVLDPSIPTPFIEKIFTYSCYNLFLNFLGKNADRLLVTTNELREFLKEKGYSSEKALVMPHGVDTRLFSPPRQKQETDFNKSFLYVGAMRPQYGLEKLIKASTVFRHDKEFELVMIGDGSERPYLMELTRKLKLQSKVVFYNYVPHKLLPKFIRHAYATLGPLRACLPNYYTLPTKILEYFACGKTTLSTRVSEDILQDGRTGIVLKSTTVKSITDALVMLMEDEKLIMTLGKNAFRLVSEKFDWKKIIDQFEKEIISVESLKYH